MRWHGPQLSHDLDSNSNNTDVGWSSLKSCQSRSRQPFFTYRVRTPILLVSHYDVTDSTHTISTRQQSAWTLCCTGHAGALNRKPSTNGIREILEYGIYVHIYVFATLINFSTVNKELKKYLDFLVLCNQLNF